jgi:shikimate dehydrogenase
MPEPWPPWPGGATRVAGVIGDPVRHSLSPVLHNAAFRALGLDWAFLAFPVAAGQAAPALLGMRALSIDGLSVTMPHKTEVAALVDRLTPLAARLGAVNTVAWEGTELVGHNTDGPGFLDSLRVDHGFDPAGRRCAVIGAGGAGRAVVAALAEAGASEVVVVNRSPGRAAEAAALAPGVARVGPAEEVAGAELMVNATPVGMGGAGGAQGEGAAGALPVDPELLQAGQVVVDIVYHPPVTALLREARARGASTVGGLGMLVHQAAHAFRLWTGEKPPLEAMSAAAAAAIGPLQ